MSKSSTGLLCCWSACIYCTRLLFTLAAKSLVTERGALTFFEKLVSLPRCMNDVSDVFYLLFSTICFLGESQVMPHRKDGVATYIHE